MGRSTCILTLLVTFCSFGASYAHAQFNPYESLVYMECRSPDGSRMSAGAGVIVSNTGRVLTTKSVAPSGYRCLGAFGANSIPTRRLQFVQRSSRYNAQIFQLDRRGNEKFASIGYERFTPNLNGQRVTAYGFPDRGTQQLGRLRSQPGTISTTGLDSNGAIATNGICERNMIGGPVIGPGRGLLGLIVNTRPRTCVLAVERFADELRLRPH